MHKHLPYKLKEYQRIQHDYRISALVSVAQKARMLLNEDRPSVLDIGCGRGEFLKEMASLGFDTYGIDNDQECVNLSSQYGFTKLSDFAEVEKIFDDKIFDLVVTSHTLEHLENPLSALKAMRNIVKQYAIICVPNVYFSTSLLQMVIKGRIPETNEGHLYEWDPSNFKNLVERHGGYEIISWHHDWVKCIPTRFLRRVLFHCGLLNWLESGVAIRLLPQLSESLIILCRVGNRK